MNSPSLAVGIRSSEHARLLTAVLAVCCGWSLFLVLSDGHSLLALLGLPVLLLTLARLRRRRGYLMHLHWRGGRWFVEQAGACRPVVLERNTICLPWFILLRWREPPGAVVQQIWLFADSASRDELRRLRRRLILQR